MKRRVLCLLASLVMSLSLLPPAASAQESGFSVNGTAYTSFDAALSAAQETPNSTLTLRESISDSGMITIDKGVFTLDLQDKAAEITLVITGQGTDVTITGTGEIQNSSGYSYSLAVRSDAKATINGCTFTENVTFNGGSVTVNGGTFNATVTIKNENVTLAGGKFEKEISFGNSMPSTRTIDTFLANGYAFMQEGKRVQYSSDFSGGFSVVKCDADGREHDYTADACIYCGATKSAAPAAKIGTTTYDSLADALVAASAGNTVTLLADAESATLSTACTLDLNGHTLASLSVTASGAKLADSASTGSITSLSSNSALGALLPEGCGFRTQTAWYDSTATETSLSSVSLRPLPVKTVQISGETTAAFGDRRTLTATHTPASASVTYQWYEDNALIESATAASFETPPLSVGVHTYRCAVTCDGYTRSAAFPLTVSRATLAAPSTLFAAVTAYSGTYDALPHAAFVVNTDKLPDGWCVAGFASSQNGTYSATVPSVTAVADSATFWVKFTHESYHDVQKDFKTTVSRADPTPPTGLSGTVGGKLSSVSLPSGWTWCNGEVLMTSAGAQSFPAQYSDTTGNYNDASNVSLTVSVAAKQNESLAVTMQGWTYGETPNAPQYTLPTGATSESVTYFAGEAPLASVPTAAGSYRVTVSCETASAIFTGSADFTISKATPTIENAAASVTYGAPVKDSDITATTNVTGAFVWNAVSSYGDAGSKTLSATFTPSDTENYIAVSNVSVSVAVNKAAAPSVSALPALTVYNALEKTYTVDCSTYLPAVPTGAYGAVIYVLSDVSVDSAYCAASAASLDAATGLLTLPVQAVSRADEVSLGSVQITVQTTNYQDISLTIPVSSKNRPVPSGAPTASATTLTYGEPLSTLTLSGTMIDPADETKSVAGSFAWADGSLQPAVQSGGYAAAWVFTPTDNTYAAATGTVQLTVSPKSVTVSGVSASNRIYDGTTAVALSGGTLDGILPQDASAVTLSLGKGSLQSADAGESKPVTTAISLAGAAAPNYSLAQPSGLTVSIAPKPLTGAAITLGDDLTYNGLEQTQSVSRVTVDGLTATFSVKDGTNKGIAATDYTLTVLGTGNFTGSASTSWSIQKAPASCTAPTGITGLTYSGGAQALVSAGSTADGTLLYALSPADDAFSAAIPTASSVGTYSVYYKVAPDANHNEFVCAAPLSVTIAKKPLTLTPRAVSAVVGSPAPDFSAPQLGRDYDVAGLVAGEQLSASVVVSLRCDGLDMQTVGAYPLSLSVRGEDSRYEFLCVPATLTITAPPTPVLPAAPAPSAPAAAPAVSVTAQAVAAARSSGSAVTLSVSLRASDEPSLSVVLPRGLGTIPLEIPVAGATSGTVAVLLHEDGTEELLRTTVPTETGVRIAVSGSVTVKFVDNSRPFDDTQEHWSREEVNFVAARGLFEGVGKSTFGVAAPMTRGAITTVLARLDGVDTSGGKTWYEKGETWAQTANISDGSAPEQPVTREQLAVMLYRFAGSPAVSGALPFTDAADGSAWAQDALLWASQTGILTGMGDGTLLPQGLAERAQVAAMLARFVRLLAAV